ncbi:putative GPI-anchored protein pfl2 isoform X1 [Tachysurus fulvidraco]|uniref:putative GPI-anchored protein pfl2 isoform X1 n=1 Tax=Tachysurus fulvidraco TaxID=1234273 RepID=UPI001FF045B0|nr:putative GPI-anchored protein pfl2 isoform X1 [Tachysurus fulvidraco]
MDWKLILTILCLTGQASTTDTSTTAPASNATTATSTSNNSTTVATNTAIASATVATNTAIASATVATNTTIASATVSTNTTIASATVSSNTTIASATVSSNTTNTSTAVATTTAPPSAFSLIFSINEPFSADLSNSSSQLFKDKSANITSQVEPLYKKKFPNFIRMIIKSFSNGSIVTNSTLEFSSDNVNVNNVTSTLQQGLTNLTFPVLSNSINATTIATATVAPNTTIATATVAPNTTNTSTTVATPIVPLSVFSLIFSINETFSADLSNSSSQLFKDKSANIISQVEPLYKKKFSNFIRMIIKSFSNGSIVTNSTLEFSSDNVNVNNVTSTLQQGLTNLTFPVLSNSINATTIATATVAPNTTIATATVAPNTTNTSTTVATPIVPLSVFSLIFSINETFSADLSNSSSQLFKDKSANIISQVEPLYKKKFSNFIRMIIKSFSNGSIVTNSTLEFSSDNVNVNNVTSTLQQGLTNLTFPVLSNSINATTIATATVATPIVPLSVFSLIFSINETFSADLSNSSSQLFKDKSANIISQVGPLYQKKFPSFIRMIIQSFSNGSIVTNSTLEFNSDNVTVNNVTSTLQEGLTNLTIPVIQGSINATTIATATVAPNTTIASTTVATTTAPPSVFSLIFSINETFSADLSNSSSQLFKDKSANIISQVGPLYKKKFSNYRQMIIKSFSNGSIVTNSTLEFNSDNVTVNDVKSTLVDGANSLTFPIDPSSIKVTQIVGNSVPSVIASSVSMMWMSLLTLLLSFALHI